MKCNVGKTDKIIRFGLAAVIAAAGLYFGSLWGLVAIVPFATALFGFCPLYPLAKISTCKKEAV